MPASQRSVKSLHGSLYWRTIEGAVVLETLSIKGSTELEFVARVARRNGVTERSSYCDARCDVRQLCRCQRGGTFLPKIGKSRLSRDNFTTAYKSLIFVGSLVLPDRIELSTSPLPRECSTTELRQHAGGLIHNIGEATPKGPREARRCVP
jgi:hypothetical protein